MGISYDIVVVYGVEYSYAELKNFITHKDSIEIADEIGCDNLINIWCENGYVVASPYYDAEQENCDYLIGYELECSITTERMKEILEKQMDIKKQIREFCEKYNVINKENEISFIIRQNIY